LENQTGGETPFSESACKLDLAFRLWGQCAREFFDFYGLSGNDGGEPVVAELKVTEIETDRLILRPMIPDDIDTMYKILSDPITMRFWPAPFDRPATERWVKRSIDSFREFGFGRFAMINKSSGELIGDCGFMRTEVNGALENDLGYILDRAYWGQGLASEAARACLDHGLKNLGFSRIVASMETGHLASKAVAEKIGLRVQLEFRNQRNRGLATFLMAVEPEASGRCAPAHAPTLFE
jgi:ribosomal-protein-alanine N-acetyltransferase